MSGYKLKTGGKWVLGAVGLIALGEIIRLAPAPKPIPVDPAAEVRQKQENQDVSIAHVGEQREAVTSTAVIVSHSSSRSNAGNFDGGVGCAPCKWR